MDTESAIFNSISHDSLMFSGSETRLIKAGSIFSYYRLTHDGKYFFFKTFSNDAPFVRKLLRREYELSIGCDNPFLVSSILYGEYVDGKEGFLTEYVEGRTLTEFLAENPPVSIRIRIFNELLEAVGYLHGRGIVHNDLKPDNILISRNGDMLKLIDFGLSDDDAHFMMKTLGCSPDYAAPELREARHSDMRSDIYSIGKIMDLIFGSRFRRFSRKCMRKEPEKRYASIIDFQKAWQGRNRIYLIGAAAVLILLITAGIGLYLEEKDRQRNQLQRVETSLMSQKALSETQARDFRELQTSYTKIKESYQGLKDSIEENQKKVLAHQQARDAAIDKFKSHLDRMMYAAYDSLKLCPTWKDMNAIRQRYDTAIHDYYTSYPKIADGEDITVELSAILQDNIEGSRKLFNKEIKRLHE